MLAHLKKYFKVAFMRDLIKIVNDVFFNSLFFIKESCFKEKYNLKIGINNNYLYFDHIKEIPKSR